MLMPPCPTLAHLSIPFPPLILLFVQLGLAILGTGAAKYVAPRQTLKLQSLNRLGRLNLLVPFHLNLVVTPPVAPTGRWQCHRIYRRLYRCCCQVDDFPDSQQTQKRAASMKATPAKARTQLLIAVRIQIHTYRYIHGYRCIDISVCCRLPLISDFVVFLWALFQIDRFHALRQAVNHTPHRPPADTNAMYLRAFFYPTSKFFASFQFDLRGLYLRTANQRRWQLITELKAH